MTKTERILVCCGTGCIANGAYEVARALEEQIAAQGANAQVELKVCRTGCSGECEQGPLVRLMPRDTMYYKVKPADAPAVIASLEGDPVTKLLYRDEQGVRHEHQADNPFYGLQHKVVLKDVGIIDPLSLEEYKSFSEAFDGDVYDFINLETCVSKRNVPGGPAEKPLRAQLDYIANFLNERK